MLRLPEHLWKDVESDMVAGQIERGESSGNPILDRYFASRRKVEDG